MIPCVVLNTTLQPLSVVSAERGLCLVLSGVAHIKEQLPNRMFHSVSAEFPIPTLVIMNEYRDTGARYHGTATLSQQNLFLRDNYRCAYCGRHAAELNYRVELGVVEHLTRDHVWPLSRGGTDEWTNVVTACSTCNHFKDNRTPDEIEDLVLNAMGVNAEQVTIWNKFLLRVPPRPASVYEILEKRRMRLERRAA